MSLGAAVAILVPLISSSLERRKMRHEANERRIDELRGLLDEASVAVVNADLALDDLMMEFRKALRAGPPEGQRWPAAVLQMGNAFIECERNVWRMDRRIAVRLGARDEVHHHYRIVAQHFQEAQEATVELHENSWSPELDFEGLVPIRDAINAAERDFLSRSSQIVGPAIND